MEYHHADVLRRVQGLSPQGLSARENKATGALLNQATQGTVPRLHQQLPRGGRIVKSYPTDPALFRSSLSRSEMKRGLWSREPEAVS